MKPNDLIPGDCLLYRRTPFAKSKLGWFFGLVINIKTWSRFSHVEIYAGNGKSFASRDGVGVGLYSYRADELAEVRRPSALRYDHLKAVKWFDTVNGQKYDFMGLLCFTLAVMQGAKDKMFCSEYAVRHYRSAGLEVLNPDDDADKAAPAQLHQVAPPILTTVWTDQQ